MLIARLLVAELQFELWIGDAAEIRTKRVRKQKTDRQDAQLILRLLLEDRFPQIWVPSWENRDLRQLLWHRHRMVQARTRIMNQLQAVALNEGLRCKKRLWRERGRQQLESFQLAPWASRRRSDLLELMDRLNPTSQPTIFISASFVPSLLVGYRKVYSARREADVVMSSVTLAFWPQEV
jgi:transposase